jgi:hypothetical protein
MAKAGGNFRPAPIKVPDDVLMGRRLLRPLEGFLRQWSRAAEHGNRALHFDQLVVAHLLVFFNPALVSLRKIQDVFDDPRVRRRVQMPRIPKSTLSDAQRVFDPQLLRPLFEDLRRRLPCLAHDPRLDQVTRDLLAVDGTFFGVAARIVWALYNRGPREKHRRGNVRAHVHFDVLRGVPVDATLTDGRASETRQLRQTLQAGRCYVADRGYQGYELLHDILAVASDFVIRQRRPLAYTVRTERPLSAADRLAGVQQDLEIQPTGQRATRVLADRALRLVVLASSRANEEPVLLYTNRFDWPAEWVGLIYRHRWQIELFFRWLKCTASFQHFFSESPQGMTLQLYIALIGTLLLALAAGATPSTYDFALLSHVASGLMTLEGALAVMAKRRAERARAKAWQDQYRARRKADH